MRRRFVLALLLASSVAACGALLGIDQLPLEEPDAAVAFEAGDAADAAPQCVDDLRLGCQQCPHAFCDDFDLDAGEAGVGSKWISAATGFVPGPLLQERDGDTARGQLVADNFSPPFGFEAYVSSDGGSGLAVLINQLAEHEAGASFAGVRYRFQTEIQTLDVATNGAKLTDAGGAIFAGIAPSDATRGIALFLNDRGLWAVIGTNLNNLSEPDGSVAQVTTLTGFGKRFLFDVYVTTRERALALHLDKCSALSTPTVVAVQVNTGPHGCFEPVGTLANLDWTRQPIIMLGSSTFGRGTIGLVHDNVQVDFLE